MRQTQFWGFLLGVALVAGCACSALAPPAAPVPGQAAPQQAGSQWDTLVAAAKQEGTVAVIGPTGEDRRDVLTQGFQQEYGINVDYFPDPGAPTGPKVGAERQAGQYNWDIYVGGTTTGLSDLIPMGALDPIQGSLVLPEVTNGANWRGGAPELIGPRGEILVMTPFQRGTLFINTNLVPADTFHSYRDLLDPQWKGKLELDDPRRAGPGQATMTFFYLQPDLGPDYIRALRTQEPVLEADYSQEIDMLGQGRFPVLIGASDALVEQRTKQGVPVDIVDPRQLKEGSDTSPASGSVSVFNRPAHPNAAIVYLNWLLSKEGQTDFSRGTGYVSSRVDVPTDFALPWRVPQPGAVETYTQTAIDLKPTLIPFLNQVFGQS